MNHLYNGCEDASPSARSTSQSSNRQSRRAWIKPTLAGFLLLLMMQVAPAQKPDPKTQTPPKGKSPDPLFDENQFVRIPSGEFMMGSANGESNEKPVHRVRISRGFELGKYEVTQAQWGAVMENNVSYFKGNKLPVERVSWDDVQEFIKKLNQTDSKYQYRLPTEAEWEYAARAGSSGKYSFGEDKNQLGEYAWFYGNSGNTTHPVGEKKPNKWG
ncbi:MAG: formylglycine-generating enzyme family protein, partial [Blastocatellia bacterium]